MSAVQKKYSGTNVNHTFYLMQYLVYQHEVIIKEYLLMFYILFFVLHIGKLGHDTTLKHFKNTCSMFIQD